MDRCAAEVVVRFAGTTVTVAHVLPGRTLRAGRDSEIALDVAPFDLLSTTSHGFAIRRDADAPAEPLGEPISLSFGNVTLDLAVVSFERTPLAIRDIERRPFAYGAGVLTAVAALLLLSFELGDPDADLTVPGMDTSRGRPTRIARFAVAAQTTKKEDKPPPTEAPITVDDTPSEHPLTDLAQAATAASLASQQSPNGHGPETVPATIESAPSEGDRRQERRFDPDANPDFDTKKVGNYTTVSTGQAAGAKYELDGENGRRKPLIVVSCDSSSCVIIGGDPASNVRVELERKLPEIVACYEKYSDTAGKKVELDFGIGEAGKADRVNVGGVGDYDSCVANIINNLTFEK